MIRSIFNLRSTHKYDVAICTMAKDEDDNFIEWIEYHLRIGVSRFYIYDNESTIPISTSLSSYVEKGIVKVEPIAGKKMQVTAHKRCLANYGSECQWIAFIDVDEFIVPKALTGNLVEFLNAYKKFGGLGINWLVFGSNGHLEKPKGSQIESFTRRALKTQGMNNHIKSIVQPKYVKKVPKDAHHFYYRFPKYCVNEDFKRIKGAIVPHTSNKIQLNHYFSRSLEEFKRKVAKGRPDIEMNRSLNEFYEYNEFANSIIDENIIELELLMKEKHDK